MELFFHKELEAFRSKIALMGSKAMSAVQDATKALMEHDSDLARAVRKKDDEIDDLEVQIDGEAVRYVTLRKPVAGDMRLMVVGMKTGHDLERVGDEATNIAKRVQRIAGEKPIKAYVDLPEISEGATEMLREALDSLFEGNTDKAKDILMKDESVDNLDKKIHRDLVELMRKSPEVTPTAIELMFISHSYERIADHACNIAEEVIYLTQGTDVRHSSFKKADGVQ